MLRINCFKSILLLVFLFNTACSGEEIVAPDCQCTNPIINTHPKSAVFQTFLDAKVKKGLPGAVMLIHDTNGIWIGASGKADIKVNRPMRPCSISRIASITKLFVSTAVLKLVEQGKLSLDDKVNFYVSRAITDNIANANHVTIRQLLNHTSGIVNYYDELNFQLDYVLNNPTRVMSIPEILKEIYGLPAYFAPGAGYRYSNSNYLLLGLVINGVSGKNWCRFLEDEIFIPLGLNNTYVSETTIPSCTVHGYVGLFGDGTMFETTEYTIGGFEPGGAMVSCVYDLSIFIEAVFKTNFITPVSQTNMLSWINIPDVEINTNFMFTRYGLGVYYLENAYGYGYGHSGGNFGYRSELFYMPVQDVTYALVVNGVSTACENITTEINSEIYKLIFK